MLERSLFGTDGIRGIAGQYPLDPETLVRLGKAVAKIFVAQRGKHRILIGKDTRLSGYMIETALASGITSMGAEVMLVGPITTPGVAYLTRSMRADAGIMISASHNSFEDNGIKIFAADGFKLADELEAELERLILAGSNELPTVEPMKIGKATRIEDALGRYTVFLKECFPRECSLDGIKIAIDAANGAGYVVGPQTLSELGAEVVSCGNRPNGKNINAGFGSLYPEIVASLVREQNLNLGMALDGDGDRLILVDEKGQVVDGDEILAVCAIDLKNRGKLKGNIVVGTVMSNLGLEKVLAANGIELHRSKVGDRYVLEEMQRLGAILGGEQSGHTIFLQHGATGDGILTALMVLSVVCRSGKKLSELTKDFVKYPQRIVNVKVSQKPPLESIPEITKVISSVERDLGESGRVLVRYSGTENKARVMVECDDDARCKQYVETIADQLERSLGMA